MPEADFGGAFLPKDEVACALSNDSTRSTWSEATSLDAPPAKAFLSSMR